MGSANAANTAGSWKAVISAMRSSSIGSTAIANGRYSQSLMRRTYAATAGWRLARVGMPTTLGALGIALLAILPGAAFIFGYEARIGAFRLGTWCRGVTDEHQSGLRRALSRQNSLPSGSARTCQCSCPVWPMSAGRAPSFRRRSSSAS
jgi:hypothetical protein